MSFYINNSGTWTQVQQSYVNSGGTWYSVKEQYINDNGTWRPIFYASGSSNYTSAGTYSFTVPAGVFSINTTVIGGGGGGGGCDGGGDSHVGGGGGSGGISSSSLSVTPYETLSITVGSGGHRASVYFNTWIFTNDYYGRNAGSGTNSYISRSGSTLIQATAGAGGGGSSGDSCIAWSGAGGSPNGVSGGSINCNRNWYGATLGGQLSGYSYGKGGNSHGNPGYWINSEDGTAGAVLISW